MATRMTISTPIPDTVALARLCLMQWLSPAFPTGAFAYSQGLELRMADGAVPDADSLHDWTLAMLQRGAGWQDAVLLAQGLSPEADLEALSALAGALATGAERWTETHDTGTAFARAASAASGRSLPARPLPLAVAEATRALPLPVPEIVSAFLLAYATNLVTIGIRHIPLGQSQGQAVLARLLPMIAQTAALAAQATPDDLGIFTSSADLAGMSHETLQPRIFRT
jgi:urease accessory protein